MLVLKIALAAVLVVIIPPLFSAACLWILGTRRRMAKTQTPNAPQSSRTDERSP